jgi:hypothetical protein
MVKNEEPGGGPYGFTTQNNVVTLQIVESSQVDLNDDNQVKLMGSATHFNDFLRNQKLPKRKFNLKDFVDPDSGFIVEKNTAGVNIKHTNYQVSGMELWLVNCFLWWCF